MQGALIFGNETFRMLLPRGRGTEREPEGKDPRIGTSGTCTKCPAVGQESVKKKTLDGDGAPVSRHIIIANKWNIIMMHDDKKKYREKRHIREDITAQSNNMYLKFVHTHIHTLRDNKIT